VEVAE
jgi:hypothetical protein